MTTTVGPTDQAARDRIVSDLDTTLFVEAGAGSGKTKSLVDRVISLVASGTSELRAIAAITFTEKAGAELRDRLRRELQLRATADPAAADRCLDALDQLDSAAIGTLHSFAQRILSENPIEAGLPPRIEVLDEVMSSVEFERRWGAFREQLFEDRSVQRSLLLLFAADVRPEALDALAAAFDENWDLVAERVPEHAPEPPSVSTLLAPALDTIAEICKERANCGSAADKLALRLEHIETHVDRLRSIDDELELLGALGKHAADKPPSFRVGNIGTKGNWDDVIDLRARVAEAGEILDGVADQVKNACAEQLGSAIRVFTLAAASQRRAAGQLEFHDLLVLARAMLRDPVSGADVRARLHERYQRLLLDEFQDTDPIQIELAVRIAAADPRDPSTATASWDAVPVAPGHLFVVGDPKQSIYRFRRADIATFITASKHFGAGGRDAVALTTNFRTLAPAIGWVNRVLGTLIDETADVEMPVPSQPDYVALQPSRGEAPTGPPVAVVGRDPHRPDISADDLRAEEANDIAATIQRVIAEQWSVDDHQQHDHAAGWRPARLGDITVLVPARTSLPFLQAALDAAHIPYRTESSSLVYATRAVRDLLMVLRAVDDPTNQLYTVGALRSSLLACGDDDLFRFKQQHGGSFRYVEEQPATVPDADPVRLGLAYLRGLHERRYWESPAELLDHIARDRRALELGFAEGRPRDVWRRIRFVIDQARAWSEATNGNLRQYLQWIERQSAEGARVFESILPETDDDAVRIMTIHAAKGLEFPITIVSGMSTVPQGRIALAQVVFPPGGEVGYRFGNKVMTEAFEAWQPVDEQMGYHERIRLLYVACTRACDHLVVSLHRRSRSKPPDEPRTRTNAELLVDGMGDALFAATPDAFVADAGADDDGENNGGANDSGGSANIMPSLDRPPPTALAPLAEWQRERDRALEHATRPTTIAATALTDDGGHDPASELVAGLQKRPRDLDLPPWLKGRYGTAIGRAVHGTLQTIDLATGAGIDAAIAAQCEAEAIPDRVDQVRELVRAALASPAVREAAANPHWREVYACAPVGERLLEGYIDLLYRADGTLVVVDYKTAATDDPAELDRRLLGYRLQGASYALTVAATTGERVTRVVFLFLTPGGAVERDLPDLAGAIDDARAKVAAGLELMVEEPVTAS